MKSKLEEILGVEKLSKEKDFIKLYFSDLGKLWALGKPAQKVFGEIIQLVEWNPQNSIHNLISLNSTKRNLLCSKLNWTSTTASSRLSQALKDLSTVDKNGETILFKLNPDTYLLNFNIASKANWSDTKLMRSIQMHIKYDMVGKTLVTIVEQQSDAYKTEFKNILEENN